MKFDPDDYLPKNATWDLFFNQLVRLAGAKHLLRAYWYVVEEIEFFPYGTWHQDPNLRENILRRHEPYAKYLDKFSAQERVNKSYELAGQIIAEERRMARRFGGWKQIQDGIARRTDLVEFRRAGSIRYNIFTRLLGKEKAVDVYLATDLLHHSSENICPVL